MQLNKLFLTMAIGIFFSWSASAATRTQSIGQHSLKKVGVTKSHPRKSVAARTKSVSKPNYSPGWYRAQSYFKANPRSIASTSQTSKYRKGKVAGNSKTKFPKSHH